MTVSEARQRLAAPTVGDALWVGLIALYLLLRLPAVSQIPVASIELHDLTLAWRAHIGDPSMKFEPTLAQAVSVLSFEWTESQQFTRWVVYAVGATVPFGLFALRQRLGEVGAAVAIIVLAFNGPALYFSSTASSVAFDLPLVIWGLVWIDSNRGPVWLWPLAGFFVATAGPIVAVFAMVTGLVYAATGGASRPYQFALAFGGGVVGLGAASFRFGLGWDGIAVPPLHHFANGYASALDPGSVGLLVPLYMIPALAGAIGGAALLVTRWRQASRPPSRWWSTVLVWWVLSVLWIGSSLASGSPVPLAAAALPSALLAGYALDAWTRRVDEFEWRTPLLAFVGAGAALIGTGVVLAGWARRGEAGDAWESAILVLTLMGAFAALALVAVGRRTMPTLVAAALVPAVALLFIGTTGVAFGAIHEPLFSPKTEQPGRELRTLAQDLAAEIGGTIVVHTSLEDDVVWPFRRLDSYAVSSGVPLDAAVVILPADMLAPQGFTPLANEWLLATQIDPPSSLLRLVRWMTARNTLDSTGLRVAVYLRMVE